MEGVAGDRIAEVIGNSYDKVAWVVPADRKVGQLQRNVAAAVQHEGLEVAELANLGVGKLHQQIGRIAGGIGYLQLCQRVFERDIYFSLTALAQRKHLR